MERRWEQSKIGLYGRGNSTGQDRGYMEGGMGIIYLTRAIKAYIQA